MKKFFITAEKGQLVSKPAIIVTAFLINVLLITSCQKEKFEVSHQPGKQEFSIENAKVKVYVASLDELYSAVNDPSNEGSVVVLAPGTYVLNSSYPNGGRLELQPDMGLQGQPGNMDAVLIDFSSLPVASFVIPAGRTGGIRMGRGTNSLSWLSVKGAPLSSNAFSVINSDLLSTETNIEISHVFVDVNGSNIGINLRNRLPEHSNRKIFAELEDCEITGAVNSNGLGLALQNANGITGALIDLTMKNNYLHGNKVGLLIFSTNGPAGGATHCSVNVKSYSDRIEGNGVGLDPTAGSNQTTTSTTDNNTTTIEMYGSSIRDNNPPGAPQLTPVNGALPGGVYAACAYNSVNGPAGFNRASNNTMRLSFYGCDISNNNGTDINAFAAWCPPATVLAGSNNLLEIFLYGISTNANVSAVSSSPVEPAGTNVVNVYRN